MSPDAGATVIDIEDRLRFTFDATWRVLQWDEDPAFVAGLKRMSTTKAVDILGTHDARRLWLFEVKDPRGHRIRYRDTVRDDLGALVADKVRDTLASATWAHKRVPHAELRRHLRTLYRERTQRVGVVLWLEDADEAIASALQTELEGHLEWLKPKVIVTNRRLLARHPSTPISGLEVTSLAGAETAGRR